MSPADSDSLRLSNTPTTTQALRCFSGLPLFMVNSIALPRLLSRHLLPFGDLPSIIAKFVRKIQTFSLCHDFSQKPRPRADRYNNRSVRRAAGHPVHSI